MAHQRQSSACAGVEEEARGRSDIDGLRRLGGRDAKAPRRRSAVAMTVPDREPAGPRRLWHRRNQPVFARGLRARRNIIRPPVVTAEDDLGDPSKVRPTNDKLLAAQQHAAGSARAPGHRHALDGAHLRGLRCASAAAWPGHGRGSRQDYSQRHGTAHGQFGPQARQPLFSAPPGLADGLAPKRCATAGHSRLAPTTWFPRIDWRRSGPVELGRPTKCRRPYQSIRRADHRSSKASLYASDKS